MYSLPKNVYRERIDFSKIKTTVPIPNLIEIQKKSYERPRLPLRPIKE